MKLVRTRKPHKSKMDKFFTHHTAVSKKAPDHVKRAQRDLEREIEREMAVMCIAMPFLPKDQVQGIVKGKLGLETGKHLHRKGGAKIDYKKISLDFPKSPVERATRLESPRNIRKKLLGRSQPFRIIRQNSAVHEKQHQKATNDAFGFNQASPIDQAPEPFARKTPRPLKRQTKKPLKRRLFTLSDDNDDILLEGNDDIAPVKKPPTKSPRRNICNSTPEKHRAERQPPQRNQTAQIQPTEQEPLSGTGHCVDSDSEDQIVEAGRLTYNRSEKDSEVSSKRQSRKDGTSTVSNDEDLLLEDNPSPVLNLKSNKGLKRGRLGQATKSTSNGHRESNNKDFPMEQEPETRRFAVSDSEDQIVEAGGLTYSSDNSEDSSNLPPRRDGLSAVRNNEDLIEDKLSPVMNVKSDKRLRRGRMGWTTESTSNDHRESRNKVLFKEQKTCHFVENDSEVQTIKAVGLTYYRSDDDSEDSSSLQSRRDGTSAVSNNEDLIEDFPSPVMNVTSEKGLTPGKLGRATKATSNESNVFNTVNPIVEMNRLRRARLSLPKRSTSNADETAEDQTSIGVPKSPRPIITVRDQSNTILDVLDSPEDLLMEAAALPDTLNSAARNRITPQTGGSTSGGLVDETPSEPCPSRIADAECVGSQKETGSSLSKDEYNATPQSILPATSSLTQHGKSSFISASQTLSRHTVAAKENSQEATLLSSNSNGLLKLQEKKESPVILGTFARNSVQVLSCGSVDKGQNYGSMQSARAATPQKGSSPCSPPSTQQSAFFTDRNQSNDVLEVLQTPEEIGVAVVPATPSDAASTNISSPPKGNASSGLVSDTPSEAACTRINAESDGPRIDANTEFPGGSLSNDVPQSALTAKSSAHQADPFISASRTLWRNWWASSEKDRTIENSMVNSSTQGALELQEKTNSTVHSEKSARSFAWSSSHGSSIDRAHSYNTPEAAQTVRPVGGSSPGFTTSTPNSVSSWTGKPPAGKSVEMNDNSLTILETAQTDGQRVPSAFRSTTTPCKPAVQIASPPLSAWNRDHPSQSTANRSLASDSSNDMFSRSGYSSRLSNLQEKTNNSFRSGDESAASSVGKNQKYNALMSTQSAISIESSPPGSPKSSASSVRLPPYPTWKMRSSEEDAAFNSPERNSSDEISPSSYLYSSTEVQHLHLNCAKDTPTSMRHCRGWSTKKGIPRVGQIPNQEMTARRMLFQGEGFPPSRDHCQEKDVEESSESQILLSSPHRRLSADENHLKDFSAEAPHNQFSNRELAARRMLFYGEDYPNSLDSSQEKDVEEFSETQILFSSPDRVLSDGNNHLKDFSKTASHKHISVAPLLLKRGADRLDGLPFPSGEAVRPLSAEWLHQKKLSSSNSPGLTTHRESSRRDKHIWGSTKAFLVVRKTNRQQSQQMSATLFPEEDLEMTGESLIVSFPLKKSTGKPEQDTWWKEDSVMRALSQLGVEDVADNEINWKTQLVVEESVQRSSSSLLHHESSERGRSWLSSSQERRGQRERLLSSQESVCRTLE